MRKHAVPGTAESLKTIYATPYDPDYKSALVYLSAWVNHTKSYEYYGLSWPDPSLMADQLSMGKDRLEVILNNMAAWGLLVVHSTTAEGVPRWRIVIESLAAQQPLLAALLKGRIREWPGIGSTALLVLEALAGLCDDMLTVVADHERVRQAIPRLSRDQWKRAISQLMSLGYLDMLTTPHRYHRGTFQIIIPNTRTRTSSHSAKSRRESVESQREIAPREHSHSAISRRESVESRREIAPREHSHSAKSRRESAPPLITKEKERKALPSQPTTITTAYNQSGSGGGHQQGVLKTRFWKKLDEALPIGARVDFGRLPRDIVRASLDWDVEGAARLAAEYLEIAGDEVGFRNPMGVLWRRVSDRIERGESYSVETKRRSRY